MVTVAFLPAEPERCCLDIDSLIATLPASIRVARHVDAATDALVWLPNIAQGNTAPEVARLLEGSNVKWMQLPMTGVDDYMPIIRATRGRIQWSCAKVSRLPLSESGEAEADIGACRVVMRAWWRNILWRWF
jgi:hypothetical protein